MQSSCITHPPDNPVAVVRGDYYELCDHNEVAAALLALFEFWHTIKLRHQPQARHKNIVALSHGEAPAQDEDLWQWHTEETLEKALLGIGRRDAIRQAIKLLSTGDDGAKGEDGKEKKPPIIGKNFISVGLNPNPRYKFDRTRYFLFNAEAVQAAINKKYRPSAPACPPPPPSPKPPTPPTSPENQGRGAENQGRGAENQFSLHENTSENTTKREESPFDSFEPVDIPAATEERLWGELTPLEATVLEITGEQSRSWAVIAKAKEAAAALAKLGLTVADLHEFDRQRSKTCKLNFLASEVGAWWRDKSKRAAPRPPVNVREKYANSAGTRFVIMACNWQDTLHVQEIEDVEAAEAVGRALDTILKGSDWDPLSPKGFADFWRNECQHTSVITPTTVRKYFGQYRDWVIRKKAA